MKDSSDIFKEAGLATLKNLFSTSKNKKEDDDGLFALLGVLLFVGSEGVTVIFRKNIGRKGLDIGMLIGCFLALGGIAAYSFYYYANPGEREANGDSIPSLLITGILFSILGLYVLLKGIFHISKALKANDLSNYKGNSDLLSFLKKDKWTETQIRFIWEPFLVLSIGGGYYFYNKIGGAALIFCAVSVWARLAVETIILGNPISQKVNEPSLTATGRKSNNRVI